MAADEHLLEERAVGVSVDVDDGQVEPADHGRGVVGRQGRRVVVGPVPQLATAPAGRHGVGDLQVLQVVAPDRLRKAGAALVDEQHVPPSEQGAVHAAVTAGRPGRGVAGAALVRHHRAEHGARVVARRDEGEADLHPAGVRVSGLPASPDRAAEGAGDHVARLQLEVTDLHGWGSPIDSHRCGRRTRPRLEVRDRPGGCGRGRAEQGDHQGRSEHRADATPAQGAGSRHAPHHWVTTPGWQRRAVRGWLAPERRETWWTGRPTSW